MLTTQLKDVDNVPLVVDLGDDDLWLLRLDYFF